MFAMFAASDDRSKLWLEARYLCIGGMREIAHTQPVNRVCAAKYEYDCLHQLACQQIDSLAVR